MLGTNIGGLGTPVGSLASLISLNYYVNENGGLKKYMVLFLGLNFFFLAVILLIYNFYFLGA